MSISAPFGRLTTAMITPFKRDGEIDWAGIEKLAAHLISTGHEGLVLNGTTGEAPTTSDEEKDEIIKVVRKVVGSKINIVAGAGNNETSHSVEQAKRAAKAGADALLVVTPYYNKPPQAGIAAHFTAMADATDADSTPPPAPAPSIEQRLAGIEAYLGNTDPTASLKDAKGNVAATSWVIKRCGIPVYSGDDILNLPLLSVGAVGVISVCGHTVGRELRELLDAWFAGNVSKALEIHQKLLPVYTGTFRTQGAILTKAALNAMGLPGGFTRLPLVDATELQIAQLKQDFQQAGINLN